jgi:hypothetical protein
MAIQPTSFLIGFATGVVLMLVLWSARAIGYRYRGRKRRRIFRD